MNRVYVTSIILLLIIPGMAVAYDSKQHSPIKRFFCIFNIGDCYLDDSIKNNKDNSVLSKNIDSAHERDDHISSDVNQESDSAIIDIVPIQNITNPVVERIIQTREIVHKPDFTYEQFNRDLVDKVEQLRLEIAQIAHIAQYDDTDLWRVISHMNAADTGKIDDGVVTNAKVANNSILIDKLADVDTSTNSPTSGQVLSWDGTNWVPTTTAANNVYTADGTLSADRTVTLGANNFNFVGTGNIGIGTTTPTHKLDVSGALRATGLATFGAGISVNGETITDFTGTGLALTSGVLTATLGTVVEKGELANSGTLSFDWADGEVADNLTITGGTISNSTLTLAQGISVAPTGEGVVEWDSDDDLLKIGDGTTNKTFYPGAHSVYTAGTGITISSNVISNVLGDSIQSSEILDGAIINADISSSAAISVSKTALTAGTNITLTGDTIDVDDAFLINSGDDTTSGTITAAGFTTTGTTATGGFTASGNGTIAGTLGVVGAVSLDNVLKILEGGSAPQYYTIFQGGDQSADITYTLPANLGTNGQILSTDGSGVLSWISYSSGLFTDGGTTTYLTSTTDDFALGGTDSTSPLFFDESAELLTLTNTTTGNSFRVNDEASDTTPFIIDENGNVGIGNTDPRAKLDITNGDIYMWRQQGIYSHVGGVTTAGIVLSPSATEDLAFHTGNPGTEKMRILSNGNVGIGTTAPSSRFEVQGSNTIAEFSSASTDSTDIGVKIMGARSQKLTGSTAYLDLSNYDSDEAGGTEYVMGRIAGGLEDISGQTGFLQFFTNSGANLTEKARITKDGNFGIGTISPNQKLSIAGNLGILEGGSAPQYYTIFQGGDQSADITYTLPVSIGSNGQVLTTDGSGALSWQSPASGLFTDGGAVTYLTSQTDDFALGGTGSGAPLFFDESAELLTLTNTTTGNSFVVNDQAGDTTPFVIDESGNVGLGTTNPLAKLHIQQDGTTSGLLNYGGRGLIISGNDSYSRIIWESTNGPTGQKSFIIDNRAGDINFSSVSDNGGSWTNQNILVVQHDGNVGIGTASPGVKLDVVGSIRASVNVVTSGAVGAGTYSPKTNLHVHTQNSTSGLGGIVSGRGMAISGPIAYNRLYWEATNAASGQRVMMMENGGGGIYFNSLSDSAGSFINQNILVVRSNGNVGIGTNNPTARLYVRGNAQTSAIITDSSGNVKTDWPSGWGGGLATWDMVGASAYFSNFTQRSDERWKKNIVQIDSALEKVNDLRGVIYEWDTENYPEHKFQEGKQLGFIAQDFERVFPDVENLVQETNEGYKSLSYSSVTALNLQAIKELNLKLEDLATSTALADLDEGSFSKKFFSSLFDRLISWLSDKANGIDDLFASRVQTNQLCVGDVCVNEAQLAALLASSTSGSVSTVSTSTDTSSQTKDDDLFVPEITILGNNPAEIEVGSVYSDLGAKAQNPDGADINITTLLDGVEVDNIELDTSSPATYTIEYRAVWEEEEVVATREVIVVDTSDYESTAETDLVSQLDTQSNTGDDTDSGSDTSISETTANDTIQDTETDTQENIEPEQDINMEVDGYTINYTDSDNDNTSTLEIPTDDTIENAEPEQDINMEVDSDIVNDYDTE